MVNKRVPEWLNSSMWSSPPVTASSPPPKSRSQSSPSQSPSHEDRIGNHTSKSSTVTYVNASVNETRESPSVIITKSPSESVTESVKEAPVTRTEVRDPLARSGSSDNEISPREDASRQAQLLEEVRNCL